MDKQERLDFIHDLRDHFAEDRAWFENKLEECKRIEGFEEVHYLLTQGQEMANRAMNDLTAQEARVENYDPKWEEAKKIYGLR